VSAASRGSPFRARISVTLVAPSTNGQSLEITKHVNLQTILCRLFVIPSNLSVTLPLELPFLEHDPHHTFDQQTNLLMVCLFTDYLMISYRSVNVCNVEIFSFQWPSKKTVYIEASLGKSTSVPCSEGHSRDHSQGRCCQENLRWESQCLYKSERIIVCGCSGLGHCVQALRCVGNVILSLPPPSPACADTSASDRSMELSEIDARLSALQEFMKKSLASRTQTGIS